jgi:hypothetical protein
MLMRSRRIEDIQNLYIVIPAPDENFNITPGSTLRVVPWFMVIVLLITYVMASLLSPELSICKCKSVVLVFPMIQAPLIWLGAKVLPSD